MVFVERESFKHKFAKTLLHEWLSKNKFEDFTCESAELEYCIRTQNRTTKVADIATFKNGKLFAIFEVYHTHRIKQSKLNTLAARYPNVKIYEINADIILNLTDIPSKIMDLCEHMNGNIPCQKRKPRKSSKPYMFVETIEDDIDNRYIKLTN